MKPSISVVIVVNNEQAILVSASDVYGLIANSIKSEHSLIGHFLRQHGNSTLTFRIQGILFIFHLFNLIVYQI